MSRRQYVARGVPGGYRIWDSKRRRWRGDHYEICPDDLLAELPKPERYSGSRVRCKKLKQSDRASGPGACRTGPPVGSGVGAS